MVFCSNKASALVIFGLLKGFLKRVHELPIIHYVKGSAVHSPSFEGYENQTEVSMSRSTSNDQIQKTIDPEILEPYADGRHSYDEICVDLGVSRRELVRGLEQLKHCYTILRTT